MTETQQLHAFRQRRQDDASGPRGSVAFVWGDFVTEPGQRVTGAPGRWSPAPEGVAGVVLHASAEDGVTLDGTLVDGDATLFHESAEGPHLARFADGAEGVVFTYDHGKYALQVWDNHSEWANRFDRIDAFDEASEWVIEAEVRPIPEGRTVAISHHRDPRPVEVPVAAEVRFTVDGEEQLLLATRFDDSYLVHFRDATNGLTSYSAGRSVQLPVAEGSVTLDFNRATLLPCSFSHAWNCPLPPAENRLPFAVEAGERKAVDAQGTPLL
jgi:uncharacterized protein (DUF1684 family)